MTLPVDPGQARYAAMRWNAPLSVDHADFLLDLLELEAAAELLDLGCGWGELLMRAVEAGGPGTTGVGVDRDEQLLARARSLARTRRLDGRVHFVCADSATWNQPADRVLCVGASHAWAGVEQALQALTRVVRPGGQVLFGEGCWERPPTAAAAAMFGQDVIALADVVRLARATGWQVLHLSTADLRECDDFEASWRRGCQRWLLDHPHDDRAGEVQDTLDAQLKDYVESRCIAGCSASATSCSAGSARVTVPRWIVRSSLLLRRTRLADMEVVLVKGQARSTLRRSLAGVC